MAWQMWFAFFGAAWVISLSPGAGAIASMSTGLSHGLRRGYWNILGLQIGLLLQVVIVAAGVGALLASSALAFTVIKWFGVAYLVYLGIRQWRAAPTEVSAETDSRRHSAAALVARGFLVNASNPKAVVFMLAVLPQFLDPTAPLVPQYAIIAATMIVVDVMVMTGYTGLAARVLRMMRSPKQQRVTGRVFSGLFFTAAAFLSLVHRGATA
ncbi:homoserine/homoserine lactone efflux protein [Rhodococcus maanshanensis]|uniref:Homoserine/homoserine lactone efflux protein n=1 Tax=Rhodococcus maanshanensis TaxID=183556 RepID=A0A1H7SY75_9NOCA|nr:homoserine/homoserine lactone efflux protein [Rhodococcus maanshanensis]SEL77533.1 homoserine/homoserine lactone efflux protein [Rhodococcus maanshanensis]